MDGDVNSGFEAQEKSIEIVLGKPKTSRSFSSTPTTSTEYETCIKHVYGNFDELAVVSPIVFFDVNVIVQTEFF